MNKRKVGSAYEERAAEYLKENGLVILEMNYRVRSGEIDIIARDENIIVFVEVKYRKTALRGYPEEAVNIYKIKQICKTADHYRLINQHSPSQTYRFDVVAIEGDNIRWYKNAFEYLY